MTSKNLAHQNQRGNSLWVDWHLMVGWMGGRMDAYTHTYVGGASTCSWWFRHLDILYHASSSRKVDTHVRGERHACGVSALTERVFLLRRDHRQQLNKMLEENLRETQVHWGYPEIWLSVFDSSKRVVIYVCSLFVRCPSLSYAELELWVREGTGAHGRAPAFIRGKIRWPRTSVRSAPIYAIFLMHAIAI